MGEMTQASGPSCVRVNPSCVRVNEDAAVQAAWLAPCATPANLKVGATGWRALPDQDGGHNPPRRVPLPRQWLEIPERAHTRVRPYGYAGLTLQCADRINAGGAPGGQDARNGRHDGHDRE